MIDKTQLEVVSTTYRIDAEKFAYRLRDTGIWVYVDRYPRVDGRYQYDMEASRQILTVEGFVHTSRAKFIKTFATVEEAIAGINEVEK
jgi:hypothetical protein